MEKIKIAVDAMGGDLAPAAVVEGAVGAVKEDPDILVLLCGQEEAVRAELAKHSYPSEQIQVVNCTEVIDMAEPPVQAIAKKKDSSIVRGMMLVRKGEAEAFVSAGSTGAVLVGGQVLVGRVKGVQRPPLGALVPTQKGFSLLIDCGANMDARPSWLLQFAEMGSIYVSHMLGIEKPRVGIVNVGAEEEKGNTLVKETFPLLSACEDLNFIGSVEARDIPSGAADVIVCDAFVGNVILKMYEGVAATLIDAIKGRLMSSVQGKVGGLLVKKPMKGVLKSFDASRYGGAPLLGLKGLVVKTHGSSKAVEIRNSILQCRDFSRLNISEEIRERMEAEAEMIRRLKKAEV